MQSPLNPIAFVVLGLITASLPYFGFPSLWENTFEIALGALLIVTGAIHWWHRRGHDEQHADTYVESKREEHFNTSFESAIRPQVHTASMQDVSVRPVSNPAPIAPRVMTPPVVATPTPVMPIEKPSPKIAVSDGISPSVHTTMPQKTPRAKKRSTKSTPNQSTQSESIPSPIRVRATKRRTTKSATPVAAE